MRGIVRDAGLSVGEFFKLVGCLLQRRKEQCVKWVTVTATGTAAWGGMAAAVGAACTTVFMEAT